MDFVNIEIPFDEAENYFKPNNKEKLNKIFYKDKNFDKLLEDTTYFLIGEKGSGKTTYCAYFCNNTIKNTKSKRYPISVDDYNKIIQMKKDKKLNYTHYATMWKAILLAKLLSTIEDNEIGFFNSGALSRLKSILEKYNFSKITMDTFSPVSFIDNIKFASDVSSSINAEIGQATGQISQEMFNQCSTEQYVYEDNWTKFINEVASDLEKLRLKNHHYLFIDGIDTRPKDISHEEYIECIYPLVRAVYDINNDILSKIKERKKGRLQIILLTRLDIFLKAGLSNAGSKISDNSAFLNWSFTNEKNYETSSLYALVNNLLNAGADSSENDLWKKYFNFNINRGSNSMDSFPYFLRLTTSKPRDFVKVLKITKENCFSNNVKNPEPDIIESDYFQRSFSTYFVDSLRTALSFYYDEKQIKVLFDFIKSFKTCTFSYKQYKKIWNSFADKKFLAESFGDCFDTLELLFSFNLVAIVEKGGYYRWKYRESSISNYDYSLQKNAITDDTQFSFHRAAEKDFGLYLK